MTGFDTNSDGIVDTQLVDNYGDGVADAMAQDLDQNGVSETVVVDSNNDGIIDISAFDVDQNGAMDVLVVDADQDGVAESYGFDRDQDGVVDAAGYDFNEDGAVDQYVFDSNENQVDDSLESSGTMYPSSAVIGPATDPGAFVVLMETLTAHTGNPEFGTPDSDHDGWDDNQDHRPNDPTLY